jgi:hypothetical protein
MKAAIEHFEQEYAFRQRRACGLLMVAVSSVRYQARSSDEDLRARLVELAREKPRFGYRRLHVLLRPSGELVNHKRVHRVYREAGLALRRNCKITVRRMGAGRSPPYDQNSRNSIHETVQLIASPPQSQQELISVCCFPSRLMRYFPRHFAKIQCLPLVNSVAEPRERSHT